MKFDELKKKNGIELNKELDATTLELMRYNAMVATGGIGKEAGKIKELKRKVARIKTIQTQVAQSQPKKTPAKKTKKEE